MRIVVRAAALATLLASACGCPSGQDPVPEKVSAQVLDQTSGQPVAGVSFSEGGQPIAATCSTPDDGGTTCGIWLLPLVGAHTITAAAPGYVSISTSFDTGIASMVCNQTLPERHIGLTIMLPRAH